MRGCISSKDHFTFSKVVAFIFGHYRQDFIMRDDVNWKKHVVQRRNPGGGIDVFEYEVS